VQGSRIDVRGVTKEYSSGGATGSRVLGPIDLRVEAGEFVTIVGPSGCGKSTLLSIVAGLTKASAGEVAIGDARVAGPYTDLGIVFQKDLLLDWRTVLDNVLLQAEVRGLDPRAYRSVANELLALVGLDGFQDHYPRELSGGMRQRVAICRALLLDPPVVLMDEPFAALDALTREQVAMDFADIWLKKQKTVIFITHAIAEAIILADRVLVMTPRPGKIDLELRVEIPHPRSMLVRETPEFAHYATEIRKRFEANGVLHQHGR